MRDHDVKQALAGRQEERRMSDVATECLRAQPPSPALCDTSATLLLLLLWWSVIERSRALPTAGAQTHTHTPARERASERPAQSCCCSSCGTSDANVRDTRSAMRASMRVCATTSRLRRLSSSVALGHTSILAQRLPCLHSLARGSDARAPIVGDSRGRGARRFCRLP